MIDNTENKPKVSVLLLTFNQEKYIEKSMESAINQQTNFEIEILIGDDCSTDSTSEKLQKYRDLSNVQIIRNPVNLGLNQNLVNLFMKCRGEYIAMLEGDDFWHSEKKLQTQVDILDKNPDCSLSCHGIEIVDDQGKPIKESGTYDHTVRFYNLESILKFNMIKNCSVMYRNGLMAGFPNWFMDAVSCDWPLHVFHAEKGNLAYIDTSLATKRVHSHSLYTAKGREHDLKHQEDFFKKMEIYLPESYKKLIKNKRLDVDYSLFAFYQKQGSKNKMIEYFKKIVFRPISKQQLSYSIKSVLRVLGLFKPLNNIFTSNK